MTWNSEVKRKDAISQVSKFKYLGSILQNDMKINENITHLSYCCMASYT